MNELLPIAAWPLAFLAYVWIFPLQVRQAGQLVRLACVWAWEFDLLANGAIVAV